MSSSPSTARIADRIRSLAITSGAYGIARRLKPESLDAVAEHLARNLSPDFTEADLIGALGRFASRHPEDFRTNREVDEELRRAWHEKALPRKKGDVNRETLGRLSPADKLAFANGENLPFVTEENDDE